MNLNNAFEDMKTLHAPKEYADGCEEMRYFQQQDTRNTIEMHRDVVYNQEPHINSEFHSISSKTILPAVDECIRDDVVNASDRFNTISGSMQMERIPFLLQALRNDIVVVLEALYLNDVQTHDIDSQYSRGDSCVVCNDMSIIEEENRYSQLFEYHKSKVLHSCNLNEFRDYLLILSPLLTRYSEQFNKYDRGICGLIREQLEIVKNRQEAKENMRSIDTDYSKEVMKCFKDEDEVMDGSKEMEDCERNSSLNVMEMYTFGGSRREKNNIFERVVMYEDLKRLTEEMNECRSAPPPNDECGNVSTSALADEYPKFGSTAFNTTGLTASRNIRDEFGVIYRNPEVSDVHSQFGDASARMCDTGGVGTSLKSVTSYNNGAGIQGEYGLSNKLQDATKLNGYVESTQQGVPIRNLNEYAELVNAKLSKCKDVRCRPIGNVRYESTSGCADVSKKCVEEVMMDERSSSQSSLIDGQELIRRNGAIGELDVHSKRSVILNEMDQHNDDVRERATGNAAFNGTIRYDEHNDGWVSFRYSKHDGWKTKRFSCAKYGDEEAEMLASNWGRCVERSPVISKKQQQPPLMGTKGGQYHMKHPIGKRRPGRPRGSSNMEKSQKMRQQMQKFTAMVAPKVTVGLDAPPGGVANLSRTSASILYRQDASYSRVERLSLRAMNFPYVHGVSFEVDNFAWLAKMGIETRRFLVKKYGWEKARLCAVERIELWRKLLDPDRLRLELKAEQEVIACIAAVNIKSFVLDMKAKDSVTKENEGKEGGYGMKGGFNERVKGQKGDGNAVKEGGEGGDLFCDNRNGLLNEKGRNVGKMEAPLKYGNGEVIYKSTTPIIGEVKSEHPVHNSENGVVQTCAVNGGRMGEMGYEAGRMEMC